MLFSEGQGRSVVSTDAAQQLGHVDGYVVDPAAQRVVALVLAKTPGKARLLPWQQLTAFGTDAVTVPSADVLVESDPVLDELAGKHHVLVGKRVLNTGGLQIGTVRDVDLDPASGELVALVTDEDRIAGDRLLGSGSFAVVVRS